MSKHRIIMILSLIVLAISIGSDAQSNPSPAVRPVAVLVSAIDNSGHPIRGLSKDKVSVSDNNRRATVADLRPVGDAPLSVGIVLLATKTGFAKQQAAAVELIQKLLRSDHDRAFVVTAGGAKRPAHASIEWKSDRDALIKEVNAQDAGTGIGDAFNYELTTQNAATTQSAGKLMIETRQAEGTSVFDVVWGMMMADKRPARRVLVLFRSAWAHSPGVGKPTRDYVDQKHLQIIQAAQQLHVAVFSFGLDEPAPGQLGGMTDIGAAGLGVNGRGDMTREADRREALGRENLYNGGRANLERMTAQTGGRAWWSSKYSDDVNHLIDALSAQYLLMFVPAGGPPGAHELKVTSGKDKIAAPGAFLVGGGPSDVK